MSPRTISTSIKVRPREQLRGRKIDGKKDLVIDFGDYVKENHAKTERFMNGRTTGDLSLYPTRNMEG